MTAGDVRGEAIYRKALNMRQNFYINRMRVARGEMSPRRCEELRKRDEDELKGLLKEVG
jgi:hypothetical protein